MRDYQSTPVTTVLLQATKCQGASPWLGSAVATMRAQRIPEPGDGASQLPCFRLGCSLGTLVCTREVGTLKPWLLGIGGTEEVTPSGEGGLHHLCPQPREEAASVQPRRTPTPIPTPLILCGRQPPSSWTGLKKMSVPGGRRQMEDDSRQETNSSPTDSARILQGRGPAAFPGAQEASVPRDCPQPLRGLPLWGRGWCTGKDLGLQCHII